MTNEKLFAKVKKSLEEIELREMIIIARFQMKFSLFQFKNKNHSFLSGFL